MDTLAELIDQLASPDPEIRDSHALSTLAEWIDEGVLDAGQRAELGERMVERFADPRVQARAFAPLILDCMVSTGDFSESWLRAFEAWYPAETDLRGHDEELGWLHTYAHGADLLGAFGRCGQVAPERMLALGAARMLAPTDTVLRDQEDDRLGYALALTLTRPELTEARALAWLDPVEAALAARERGPAPAHLSNTLRTLRMLFLLVDRGVRPQGEEKPVRLPHCEALRERLADVLHVSSTYMW